MPFAYLTSRVESFAIFFFHTKNIIRMVDYEPDPCNSGAILFDLSPYRGGTTIKVYPPIGHFSRTVHNMYCVGHRVLEIVDQRTLRSSYTPRRTLPSSAYCFVFLAVLQSNFSH